MNRQIIKLGTWDGKPIEWIVLKEEDFGTLVISKSILFSKRFDKQRNHSGNKWDECELRQYLNNDFFEKAFNDVEKRSVVYALILGDECPNTKDNIFLLSCSEASSLFNGDSDRSMGSIWSLRSPHHDGLEYTSHVRGDGVVKNKSSDCTYTDCPYGIRPAMYVRDK